VSGEVRLDTHVVVWLFTGERERFSPLAVDLLEECRAVICPMVQLELTFLHEIGRLSVGGAEIVDDLEQRIGLGISEVTSAAMVAAAAPLEWTRDPFDRCIAGDALAAGSALLTMDRRLLEHLELARW
jgi:PIN domain nuclease of toxin-antitoxin system